MKNMTLDKLAKEYILDCINTEAYDIEATTPQEKLQVLHDAFIKEYWYEYNIQRYHTQENAFREWIMGLPSIFNIVYSNYDILQLAKKWGSLKENPTPRQEDAIIENYFNFISVKTFQLFRKYKVI